jgi:threonine dehydrogenase-like Zn-dependent dehydrogenase
MQALVFKGGNEHAFVTLAIPEPGPGQVRVKIARAAVCGTDVHKLARPASRQPLCGDGAGGMRSVISGHEPTGWIDALAAGVTGPVKGTRVLVAGVIGCGRCARCIAGFNTACEGGGGGLHATHDGSNAPYIVIPAANVFPLPDSMSFDTAAVLTCAGGTAMTMVKETNLSGEDTVAIVGLGPVGLCMMLLAQSYGCRVVGIDRAPARLEKARALGLQHSVDAAGEDLLGTVRRLCEGRGADVVAECAGTAGARLTALQIARRRGRVALSGIGEEPDLESVTALAIRNDLLIRGIAATPALYFPLLIERADRCNIPFHRLVTHHFALPEAGAALALMATGKCGKILIDMAEAP